MAALTERALPSERMHAYRLATDGLRWSCHLCDLLRGLSRELAEVLDDTMLRAFSSLCAGIATGDPAPFFEAPVAVCKASGIVELLASWDALDAQAQTALADCLRPLRDEVSRLLQEATESDWCPLCEQLEEDGGPGPS